MVNFQGPGVVKFLIILSSFYIFLRKKIYWFFLMVTLKIFSSFLSCSFTIIYLDVDYFYFVLFWIFGLLKSENCYLLLFLEISSHYYTFPFHFKIWLFYFLFWGPSGLRYNPLSSQTFSCPDFLLLPRVEADKVWQRMTSGLLPLYK